MSRERGRASWATGQLIVDVGVFADSNVDHGMTLGAFGDGRADPRWAGPEHPCADNGRLRARLRSDLVGAALPSEGVFHPCPSADGDVVRQRRHVVNVICAAVPAGSEEADQRKQAQNPTCRLTSPRPQDGHLSLSQRDGTRARAWSRSCQMSSTCSRPTLKRMRVSGVSTARSEA